MKRPIATWAGAAIIATIMTALLVAVGRPEPEWPRIAPGVLAMVHDPREKSALLREPGGADLELAPVGSVVRVVSDAGDESERLRLVRVHIEDGRLSGQVWDIHRDNLKPLD